LAIVSTAILVVVDTPVHPFRQLNEKLGYPVTQAVLTVNAALSQFYKIFNDIGKFEVVFN